MYKPMWSLSNYLINLKRKEDILIGVSDLTEYRPGSLRRDTKEDSDANTTLQQNKSPD